MEKQNAPRERSDLQRLIDSKIEESGTLEFKEARALDRKKPLLRDDISKDVSAFANAAGGTLIYGIKEFDAADKKHLPESITPIDAKEYSREWLDQMIGQIQPRIEGLEILPVHVGPAVSDFCYVVLIPSSGTAHQATDKRYYKRRNFEVTAMDDYEVRDVMNRRKNPRLSVLVKIVTRVSYDKNPAILFNIKNEGNVMARHYGIAVAFPYEFGQGLIGFQKDAYLAKEDGKMFWRFYLSNGLNQPLFPQSVHSIEKEIDGPLSFSSPPPPTISEIVYTVYADSMDPLNERKEVAKALAGWA